MITTDPFATSAEAAEHAERGAELRALWLATADLLSSVATEIRDWTRDGTTAGHAADALRAIRLYREILRADLASEAP